MTSTPTTGLLELQRTEKYVVHEAIARGGMASVHIGVLHGALGFSRIVAIKRLHAQFTANKRFVSMLVDEARLASRIRHVNVVTTLDILESSGEVFVIMEYLRGASLAKLTERCAERNELAPLRISVPILVGALRGLDAAHEATDLDGTPLGIVHRDVSPSNILVGVAGTARVIDFGVARALGQVDQTQAGEFKGKLAYAAPEQVEDGGTVTRHADVFAVGIVLWELLTGQRLFRGATDLETLRKVIACDVPDPMEIFASSEAMRTFRAREDVAALAPIAMRALSKDQGKRYTSAAEMATALEAAIQSASPHERGIWVQEVARHDIDTEHSIVRRIEERIARGSHGAAARVRTGDELVRETSTVVGGGSLGVESAGSRAPSVLLRPAPSWTAVLVIAVAALVGAGLGSAIALATLGR